MNSKPYELPGKLMSLSMFELRPNYNYAFTLEELRCVHYLICDYSINEVAEIFGLSQEATYKMRERTIKKANMQCFEGLVGWLFTHGIFVVKM
ncbi:MAG: sigma-70 family RNA polymerase sigma factor [Chitinophagaceae bacterium]|nr:sigma-70 family RNA polymerase sigma factor [Chitinophagaceae bacterium]